jgi:hypothetical protein
MRSLLLPVSLPNSPIVTLVVENSSHSFLLACRRHPVAASPLPEIACRMHKVTASMTQECSKVPDSLRLSEYHSRRRCYLARLTKNLVLMLSTLLIASVIIEAVRTKLPSVYQLLAWPAIAACLACDRRAESLAQPCRRRRC